MRKLVLGALLAALAAPAAGRAEEVRGADDHTRGGAVADHQADRPAGPAQGGDPAQPADDAEDYAARDQAAAGRVGEFQGGADGVYLSAGAILVAVLLVVLLTQL